MLVSSVFAHPPELKAVPAKFHVTAKIEREITGEANAISQPSKKITFEANSWYLGDRIIVAIDYGGHLEVVSWDAWIDDYAQFELRTRYFIDPKADGYLNFGGTNNHGPSNIAFAAAPYADIHISQNATTRPECWAVMPDGRWGLILPYAPQMQRMFSVSETRVSLIESVTRNTPAPFVSRRIALSGDLFAEIGLSSLVLTEAFSRGAGPVPPGLIYRTLATISRAESLPEDTTEDEILSSLIPGMVELKVAEHFSAETKTVQSVRRGVTAPARSPVGDKEASVVFSQDAPPVRKSRVGMGGIVLAILAGVALIIGIAMRPKASSSKRSR